MADKRTLLKDGIVISVDPKVGNFMKASVLIEGTKIAQVGPNVSAGDAEVIDASNMIIMPGFIDTHRHICEGILRNICTDVPLEGDASYLASALEQVRAIRPRLAKPFRRLDDQDLLVTGIFLGAFKPD